MSDAGIFVAFFGGFFVLRLVATTIFFLVLLPRSDRCPNCDAPTEAIASILFDRLLRGFRKRWCLRCGWHGVLRRPARRSRGAARALTP